MRSARFYASIVTAVIAMFVTWGILANIPIAGTTPPPSETRGPLIVSATVDVTASHEISSHDAVRRLRSYLASYDPYDVPRDCLDIRNTGYEKRSYTLDVENRCTPQPQVLGRWRVDAVTRQVSRERSVQP